MTLPRLLDSWIGVLILALVVGLAMGLAAALGTRPCW